MGELSTSLSIRHFDNDNENSRILPKAPESSSRNDLNSLYGMKRFENEMPLRCSSALHGLYIQYIYVR